MLPENIIKEELGYAYIKIVTNFTGKTIDQPKNDYGIDAQIHDIQQIKEHLSQTGFNLDIQIKSSSKYNEEPQYVKYALRSKNYNDLCTVTGTPRILVLFCLPEEKAKWIIQNHNVLELRNCAYWLCLQGQPKTQNSDNVTITISKNHIFSSENLNRIFDVIKQNGDLNAI